MNESSRHRLGVMAKRYDARLANRQGATDELFDDAFRRVRDEVIRPVMEEVAVELRAAGHAPSIAIDEGDEIPSIVLHAGLRGARAGAENVVAFCVVRRGEVPDVLSYLTATPPPMDLLRYARAEDITREHVERIVVDSLEQIFAVAGA